MPPASVDLESELTALAEAGADALARLERGDETGVVTLIERRERLLEILSSRPVKANVALAEAARRALGSDAAILAALAARKAEVAGAIERVSRSRRSLGSYRPAGPRSAVYLERLVI